MANTTEHRQRREQRPADAAQEQDRHEDNARSTASRRTRGRHLRRSVENGLPQGLAEIHVPVIVLDLDGGVVHQDAYRERHPAQRHHVEATGSGSSGR